MSLDYCTIHTSRFGNVLQSQIVNGSYSAPGMIIYSKSYQWIITGFSVHINTAATSATQYVALQLADVAGSFASPTELARITILSSHAALTQLEVVVADTLVQIPAGRLVRLAHVAPSTDATLNYNYEIYTTTRNN